MAIPGMSGATPMDPNYNMDTPEVAAPKTEEMFNYGDSAEEKEKQVRQQQAKNYLQGQIGNGNSTYITNLISDDIYVSTGKMTLQQIEKAYNLPQGTLRHDKPDSGYYGGQIPLNGEVYISVGTMADALGISKADLKKMYSKEQIVTLKQNIENSWEAIKARIK